MAEKFGESEQLEESERLMQLEHNEEWASEVQNKEILELYKPIKNILEQIKNRIRGGEYSLIIGEDASGRVPALIVSHVIKMVYEKNGHKYPEVKFFAGGRRLFWGEDDAYLGKIESITEKLSHQDNSHKVLVVTDTIDTGASIEPISEALNKIGIRFDVITIGHLGSVLIGDKNLFDAEDVFSGGSHIPEIHGKHNLSGVKKERWYVFSDKVNSEDFDKSSRSDIKIIADKITKDVFSD
ncbi:MAG: hypothetical protein COV29_02295 [Candidatus Yanofskybacteria bacterium CG10_big_fil_rev_8_21_14_0_10_36_16]|uniref:Phosphoribosyltransferase domain-containing protein n=1 Tax=Candidatus Yanofskybacteria bacterium CG10_big_fil_rev_8_21_14_0_10_36_16 TaxID=1975096 RepID=A0A2J0Q7M0_9BACT|nr:MAG: hypothetical protein COV29_02295 [Candidatus Yanofskybacteria bacterium CG10_big_fil_rev_8_21_14_0_10_36_16]